MIVDAGLPDLVRIPLSILHGVDLLQDGGNTHSISRVSSPEAAPTGILARNLAAGSVFQRIEYLLHVYRLPASYLWRESNGSVLATRSALTGSNRPVPRPRTAAQETVVRRAVAPAHARALRGTWIAESEHVFLLFEPGRYPVAYFPETDVSPHTLERTDHTTQHPDLGLTSWYSVRAGEHVA